MEIRYEEISKDNVQLLKDLQRAIFPENAFENGYDILLEKGPAATGNVMQTYFIAFVDGEPAGTFGLYIPNGVEEHRSIWLGWYGILPKYRGKGVGGRILADSMDMARAYNKTFGVVYYRLYTSETDNASAQPLYNKVLTLKEYYKNEEMFSDAMLEKARARFPEKSDAECKAALSRLLAVFSVSLYPNEILVPWDSYYMGYTETLRLEGLL